MKRLLACAALVACSGTDSGAIEITGYLDAAKIHVTSVDGLGEAAVAAEVLGEPGAASNLVPIVARNEGTGEEAEGTTTATGAFSLSLEVSIGDEVTVDLPDHDVDPASVHVEASSDFPEIVSLHASAPDSHGYVRIDVATAASLADWHVYAADLDSHHVTLLTPHTETAQSGQVTGDSGDHGIVWGVDAEGVRSEAHALVVP